MLLILFWSVIGLLVGMTVLQVIYVWLYRRFLRTNSESAQATQTYSPKTAVILCVRGEDPTLFECLTGLGLQTYSHFDLHIVADSDDDPAIQMAKTFYEDQAYIEPKPVYHVFNDHPKTRSLKCSAIIHAVSNLPPSVEVIALIDADVVADPEWLADLIRPLFDEQIGATTGNRWFAPNDKRIGSLVRQAWNAGAVPQMIQYNIPWGGSLAIKKSTIETCNLLSEWETAFCEDTLLTSRLKKHNLRVVRVPNLIAVNGESTNWNSAIAWISRQLLTVRLHHVNWPLVVIHGIASALSFLAPLISAVVLLSAMKILFGTILLLVFLLYQLINMGLIEWVRNGNEKVISQRGSPINQPSQGLGSKFLISILTQYTYVLAVTKTVFAKSVFWRGIEYLIKPGKKIEMREFWTYREIGDGQTPRADASIE